MKCCELTAADLRHRITLEQPIDVSDGQGGIVRQWAAYAIGIRAKVQPVSVREAVQFAAIQSPIGARCFIRYRPGVNAQDRVVFNGRAFELVGEPIDLEFSGRWLELQLMADGVEVEQGAQNVNE